MAMFQKPENALKRAEELSEVGKKQDALDTLNAALQQRKFRSLWTPVIQDIMIKHLNLCVELKKMRTAREGLYQYRTMCQAANISSLEVVVQSLRLAAEEKVNEAKKQKDLAMVEMADLDEMEAPQTILLKAIQAQDTRQQSQDRDVHMHFRFLWDTYKVILEVLKSNKRLEEVYHETARHAFDFCRQNQRPQEFKRLCDTLRKNFQDLTKPSGKTPPHQADPNSPDTMMRTLETRCKQLQISTELDLWREAYQTATEIYELMSKAKVKPHLRSLYYDFLGHIFWKSENHLFHAFACLKNLIYVKATKNTITKEELQLLASKAVLATLCVPFQKTSDIHATLELTTEGASSPYEKAKKHAQLFNALTVPTRDTISQNLVDKQLLSLAAEPCKKLFALIESDFTPLSLCQDTKPYLDELATGNLFDGKLVEYITPLKQIIFFRLMKQLTEVYANMTIEKFEHAASIVPFSIAEKWMANAARQHGISIQINYSDKAIVFGAPRKVDIKCMRQPLIEIGLKLQQAMQRVAPEEQHRQEKLEKQQLSSNIVKRIEEETKLIRQRKEEIERRKEESEKRKEAADKAAMQKQRKAEEEEERRERIRQEDERIKREREREEQKKREQELVKNRAMLEEMKKQADLSKASNLKIEGKKLTEIDAEDMTKLDPAKIIQAREAQKRRDRQEKIRQRKLESKRVDHLARALREEECARLEEWAEDIANQDWDYIQEAEEKLVEQQRAKHQEALAERDAVIKYCKAKDNWKRRQLLDREDAHNDLLEERRARLVKQLVQMKIDNARKRYEEAMADKEQKRKLRQERAERERREREEEEKREQARREEEERREEEQRQKEAAEARKEERRRQQQENLEAADRAAQKRAEREAEIEARQQKEKEEMAAARRGGGGAGGAGDRSEGWGNVRKENDRENWRSRGRDEDEDRRPGGGKPAARTTAADLGSWRSGPGPDREDKGLERAPMRSGGMGARGGPAEPAGGGAWRTQQQAPAPRDSDDRSGAWRRDAPPRGGLDSKDSGPWRRDEPRDEAPRSAWGRPPARDSGPPPASREAPARTARAWDDDEPQQPSRGRRDEEEPASRAAPLRKEQPEAVAPAPAEDDDGDWSVAVGSKKKKGKATEAASDPTKVGPWKGRK